MYRCVLLISVIMYQLSRIFVSSVIQLSTFRVVGVVICTQFFLHHFYFSLRVFRVTKHTVHKEKLGSLILYSD
jgi:hypothetical protein